MLILCSNRPKHSQLLRLSHRVAGKSRSKYDADLVFQPAETLPATFCMLLNAIFLSHVINRWFNRVHVHAHAKTPHRIRRVAKCTHETRRSFQIRRLSQAAIQIKEEWYWKNRKEKCKEKRMMMNKWNAEKKSTENNYSVYCDGKKTTRPTLAFLLSGTTTQNSLGSKDKASVVR